MSLTALLAICAPFSAAELSGDVDAAFARRLDAWNAQVAAYRPDYSDSSACLRPPTDNRLDSPFAVVSDGRPCACIVLDPTSREDRVLRHAAEELQGTVALLTGVTLPIAYGFAEAERRLPSANGICLGKRLLPGARPFSDDVWRERLAATDGNCGKDGYAIRLDPANPRHLHVFGVTSKGTMNGVFTLLENNADIIWSRPDEELGTVFTPTPGKLEFVWGRDFVTAPATRARGWNGGAKGVVWASRNRCNLFNGGGGLDISHQNDLKGRYGVYCQRHIYGHTLHFFLRGCEDPEIFARDEKGNRLVGTPGWGNNPCFTSPRALDVFASNLVDCARMSPAGTDKIYVAIEDTWDLCRCANCLKPIRLADGTLLAKEAENFRSTQVWTFYNRAAERLSREVPGMKLVNLAYFFSAPPPACAMRPDVHPEFAPYVRTNDKAPIFAPENAVWMKWLIGWGWLCKDIETYDYYGLGLGFPRPLADVRAWDFAVMNPFVVGLTSENNTMADRTERERAIWDVSAMEQWVMTRLYWDPAQDIEKLRKYFIRRTYREAAPTVERVYGLIRNEWFKSPRASTLGDDPIDLAKLLIVSKGHAPAVSNMLERAVATAVHPKAKVLATRLRDRLLQLVNSAAALVNPKAQLPLVRVEADPDYEDAVWTRAATLEPFVRCFKSDGKTPALHPTDVRAFHDSDNLRLRIRCTDPDIARVKKAVVPDGAKELIVEGVHLEIYVGDPLSEGSYYLFSVSPDDVAADWASHGGTAWDGVWSHRARRTPDGWEALVTIPLKTVRADNAKGNDLKLQIVREASPIAESASWGGGGWHQFAQFGDVKLLR